MSEIKVGQRYKNKNLGGKDSVIIINVSGDYINYKYENSFITFGLDVIAFNKIFTLISEEKILDKAFKQLDLQINPHLPCSHKWKTDHFFSKQIFKTCTKCSAKYEEVYGKFPTN